MRPLLIYCYDSYCIWSYGFTSVLEKFINEVNIDVEILSGGMILPNKRTHISVTASYILSLYKSVEKISGINFGNDFLWHINNVDDSDWYPNSEKPAIALCIVKEIYPEKSLSFAREIQIALFKEGRDITDDEAYRHLLEKYQIQPEIFYQKLHDKFYKDMAHHEFSLVKQLQVQNFPTVFLQTEESKFYKLAEGFTNLETLKQSFENVAHNLNLNY